MCTNSETHSERNQALDKHYSDVLRVLNEGFGVKCSQNVETGNQPKA